MRYTEELHYKMNEAIGRTRSYRVQLLLYIEDRVQTLRSLHLAPFLRKSSEAELAEYQELLAAFTDKGRQQ